MKNEIANTFIEDAKVFKGGRPRTFKNGEEFLEAAGTYCNLCEKHKRMVSIAGFCSYASIGRTTYSKQKDYYPEEFEKIELMLEDCLINAPCNQNLAIMQLANKFGYTRTDRASSYTAMDPQTQLSEGEIRARLESAGYKYIGETEAEIISDDITS